MHVNMCVSAGAISVCYSKESDRATTVISKHTHGYNQTIWLQVTKGERERKRKAERDSGGKTNEGVEIKTLRWRDKMKRAENGNKKKDERENREHLEILYLLSGVTRHVLAMWHLWCVVYSSIGLALKDNFKILQPRSYFPTFLCQRDSWRQNVLKSVQSSPLEIDAAGLPRSAYTELCGTPMYVH